MIRIKSLTSSHETEYSRFVDQHPAGLLYHSLAYRDLIAEQLACESEYLVALEDDEVAGVLPVMSATGSAGRVLNSLPFFGSNGGVLARDSNVAALLWDRWAEMSTDRSVASATVVGNPLLSEAPPPIPFDLQDERIGGVTSLSHLGHPEDDLLSCFDSSARRNIRKARSLGVRVVADCGALSDLHGLHHRHMTEIGGTEKPLSFFLRIPEHFRPNDEYQVYLAHHEHELVAALLTFRHAGTAEYFTPATLREHRGLQASALVISHAMLDAARAGCMRWNWGGSLPSQPELLRFKRKWGSRPSPYRYFTKLNAKELLSWSRESILDAYPGFFVVPFAELHETGRRPA